MEIRRARRQDAAALARMRWDFRTEGEVVDPAVSYAEYEARFNQFFTDALTNGRWTIWVVEQDAELIAHVYVQIIEKVPRPGGLYRYYGYVTNVYARPEYRNQGLGSQLMQYVLDWAKAQELEFIILWPSARSVPYYERIGFEYPDDILRLTLRED